MADMVGSSVEVKFVIPFTSTKDGEAYDPFDMLNLHSVAPSGEISANTIFVNCSTFKIKLLISTYEKINCLSLW